MHLLIPAFTAGTTGISSSAEGECQPMVMDVDFLLGKLLVQGGIVLDASFAPAFVVPDKAQLQPTGHLLPLEGTLSKNSHVHACHGLFTIEPEACTNNGGVCEWKMRLYVIDESAWHNELQYTLPLIVVANNNQLNFKQ